MAVQNVFTGGFTDLLILFLLNQKDCYVYEITKLVSELSDGMLEISQNTVYTAAYKLENDHKISEYSKLVGKKRTRVYYHIEDAGRIHLQEMLDSFYLTYNGMLRILSRQIKDIKEDENE